MASVLRMTGDLAVAEDAVQEACLAALAQWPDRGWPDQPRAWLTGVARHKAVDLIRREAARSRKEAAAMRDLAAVGPPEPEPGLWPWPSAPPSAPGRPAGIGGLGDDELGLIFMCCHPALALEARVALTLRCVCGLSTAQIAAGFLVPEATMARRLSRAKAKIADSGIRLRQPAPDELPSRLAAVLRVTYLVFTEGHKASRGPDLVRGELCDAALRLARGLAALLPGEPEVTGLLALLLLTDARRAARTDDNGDLVLLEEQDRTRWDQAMIADGEGLLVEALRMGQPGPYQLWAAIAACHSTAASAAATDWRQISVLYGELLKYDPSPVTEANRAIAVAMAEGSAAGLTILDVLLDHPQLATWPRIHVARADLLARIGRDDEAARAYRTALELEPSAAERRYIQRRLAR